MKRQNWLGMAALLLTAVGCGTEGAIGQGEYDHPEGETQTIAVKLEDVFQAAANEYAVPVELLESIAWAETRWQMVVGEDEVGLGAAYGVMALRGAQLERGAKLAGVSIEAAQTDAWANVRAAAALLSATAAELGIDRQNLADWASVVAQTSGIEEFEGQQSYVHGEVYSILQSGISTEAISIPGIPVVAKFPAADGNTTPGLDYADSVWRPSPNYSARPSSASGKPSMVIIHTCEGSYSGCWNWLKMSKSKVSAHYVVNSSGSEITQLVREKSKAWHMSADYKCKLNSKQECDLDGASGNNFTIGIEHAGFGAQTSWAPGLLKSSAKLTCDITKAWGIPRDKYHIVGHGQLQPYNRVDPGKSWPWGEYLALVNSACSVNPPPADPQDPQPPADPQDPPPPADPQDPPPPPQPPPPQLLEIVVDSNNSYNPKNASFFVKGTWTSSTSVNGYYNTGYWWRSVGPTSDLAEFRINLASPKKMKVFAWWTAAGDRSAKAPFFVFNASETQLDTVYVNQQQNGSQWVELGTYSFTTGWNVVALGRWTSGSGVVVGDAVRFLEVK
ncbi:MAG: N-acetylmuramoyl-L-alanine amidase [Deltaproteobacteria bacterium]|nr:N-acetylmuramoyl-L-alanine amidase [Deltaproteobacteria bacterium]